MLHMVTKETVCYIWNWCEQEFRKQACYHGNSTLYMVTEETVGVNKNLENMSRPGDCIRKPYFLHCYTTNLGLS